MITIPYSRQEISDEDIAAVVAVLKAEMITQGPIVPAFEKVFAKAHNVPFGVAVTSATAGLHLACLALNVGPSSRVWTSPNSFVASANCARYCGASVDFVDIDTVTRNLSVELLRQKLETAQREGKLPDLVIPVDFSGLACDLKEMRILADQYGFRILEDASHATGASYRGQMVGSQFADATVFSFHAVKIVTTAEGGLVTTRNKELARRVQRLRSHGITREAAELEQSGDGSWYYEQHELGFNYRMTELQAALGLSQMQRLGVMHSRRAEMACRYDQKLADLPLILPPRLPDRVSSLHLYAVEIDPRQTRVPRAEAFKALRAAGIGVNVHYIPIHTQPYYRRLGFQVGQFPNSEQYYGRALSLPLFPIMTEAQQDRVIGVLTDVFSG